MPPPKDPKKYALWLERQSKSHKGKQQSEETCHKRSESLKGNKNSLGNVASEETRKKMSESHKGNNNSLGNKASDETKHKMSESRKQWHRENPKVKTTNKDICLFCGKEFERQKASHEYKFCSRKCMGAAQLGENHHNYNSIIVHCENCGKELTLQKYRTEGNAVGNFCNHNCRGEWLSKNRNGENSSQWEGGITTLNNSIRSCTRMDEWKQQVFARDNYCDRYSGLPCHNLEAHHIIPFAEIMKKYNITSKEEALACDELWDINNGVSMSEENHKAYHKTQGISVGDYLQQSI